LVEKDFHFQPNDETNSVAINITHLYGNMMSRWTNFLTEDGEKEWRQRDDEFEVHDYSREKLLELWEQGWLTVFGALQSLRPAILKRQFTSGANPCPLWTLYHRQLTHYSYHVGQIVMLGKIVKGAKMEESYNSKRPVKLILTLQK
jgi:hypothetical protein